jgi:RNA polymerase sigma factor (sigma-70 family)
MVRSFEESGWAQHIRGPKGGGLVEGLTIYTYDKSGYEEIQPPIEIAIPDYRELQFAQNGFIPLLHKKNEASATFFSAQSIKKPRSFVEDVVHDVFVNFAKTAGRFELSGGLKAYLSICVANRARDVNRSQSQREAQCADEVDPPTERPDPEAQTMCQEISAAIDNALTELPEEQREVVVLHLQCGLPFRRIAELRGISVNTATSRYRYGLEKLRTAVNGSYQHA